MKWKDVSSYSKDETPRIPKSWDCAPHPALRITVTRGHINYKGKWVMHCYPWFDCRQLKAHSDDVEGAQSEALAIVRKHVAEIAAAFAKETP